MAAAKKITFAITLSWLAAVLSSTSFASENAAVLLRSLQKKFSHVKSLAGDFQLVLHNAKAPGSLKEIKANGKLYVQNGALRMETQMILSDPDTAKTTKMQAVFILNKDKLWETVGILPSTPKNLPFTGSVDVTLLKKKFLDFFKNKNFLNLVNPAASVTQLEENHVHVLGETSVGADKLKAKILEGPLLFSPETFDFSDENIDNTPAKMTAWVETGNGIAYQTILSDRMGKEIMHFSFTTLKVNPNLNSALFTNAAPGKVSPTDMTPMMEDSIQKTLERKNKERS